MYNYGLWLGAVIGGFLWTFFVSILLGLFAFKDDFDPDRNARYATALAFLICLAIAAIGMGLLAMVMFSPFYFIGALPAFFIRRWMFRRRAAGSVVDTETFE